MEEAPNTTILSTLWYSETLTGEKTQVSFIEEIPQLESAPDSITGSALDIDYEFSQPGKRKAEDIEIPIYYTRTQHKRLKNLDKNKNYFWFVRLPESTVEEDGEEPLVMYFQGKIRIAIGDLSDEDWIKDNIKLYKTTEVKESDGFPKTNQ